MAINIGKKFEGYFKEDWEKCFPDDTIFRIPDQVSRYKDTSKNVSDFIAFTHRLLFLLECKTTKLTTFNFNKLTQYDAMVKFKDKEYTHVGVIIYFYNHDVIYYVPIETIRIMKQDGKKSVNVNKSLKEGYNIKVIPVEKKRVYVRGDYSDLINLKQGE